jgi:hypothetical protein
MARRAVLASQMMPTIRAQGNKQNEIARKRPPSPG